MTPGEVSDLEWLLAEIARLPDGPGAKDRFMQVIERMVGLRVYFSARVVLRAARVQEAARMLESGAPRAQVRERLMRRYQVGKTTAYKMIEQALTVRASAKSADEQLSN